MRIAFYAPLKAPDHPVPSGDRQMARLLISALRRAGHDVDGVSDFRSFLEAPSRERQDELSTAAAREVERIASAWSKPGQTPPQLWFTYHNHYKAPDLLGPALASRFGHPYLIAEASHAPKRASRWTTWHDGAEAATRRADAHLFFTERDRVGLARLLGGSTPLIEIKPFIDTDRWPEVGQRPGAVPVRIVTVAMMRSGDKLASYRMLAASLTALADLPWHLTVIGDGPACEEVRQVFAALPSARLSWRGTLPPEAVITELAAADLYAWPGFGEAFGLSYLEAQAMGLPVVALATAGVPSVVRPGETGLLVADPTPVAYAGALKSLIEDRDRRETLGRNGSLFVRGTRTLEAASRLLDETVRSARGRWTKRLDHRTCDDWRALDEALDRSAAAGRQVEVWLRDDDAVMVTPALERMTDLCERYGMPMLLAVIPAGAKPELARFVSNHDILMPTQHGFAHVNHAALGQRARELGGTRPATDVVAELTKGRTILAELFGSRLQNILVPPWNRIDDAVVDALPDAEFSALSTFGNDERGQPRLARLNSDLDIIDWRNGGTGHAHAKLVTSLAALVARTMTGGEPIGLLTHHLAHDGTAWSFVESCLARLATHPAVRFAAADELLHRRR